MALKLIYCMLDKKVLIICKSSKISQSLKKLLQEAGVPPWERDVIPLVYFDNELVAVAGLWVSKGFSVGDGESGWLVAVGSCFTKR